MTIVNQRERILDIALDLMADRGADATSMRQLATACDLNVAALYHYFPSKADLLRSVIEERQYYVRLRELPELAADTTPRTLLSALIVEMWQGAEAEERIWRLLLGEGLRGDETALAVGRELLEMIEISLEDWLRRLFPEYADRVPTMVALITSQLFAFFIERLFRPDWTTGDVRVRADQIAGIALPDPDEAALAAG